MNKLWIQPKIAALRFPDEDPGRDWLHLRQVNSDWFALYCLLELHTNGGWRGCCNSAFYGNWWHQGRKLDEEF
jgi:hypothetical protein